MVQYAPCYNCFGDLLKELSEEFKPRGWLLSAAVSTDATAAYDVPHLAQYLDWISLMSFYHGNFKGFTKPYSPLYATDNNSSIDSIITYFIEKGAPSQKLILGIQSYGHSFQLANADQHGFNASTKGPGEAGRLTKTPGTLSYYEICDNTKRNGWTVVRDLENNIGPYAFDKNQWVSFNDVENVRTKGKYIHKMNLGGGMLWTLDYDDFTNSCGCGYYPLLTAMNHELRRIGGKPIHNCA